MAFELYAPDASADAAAAPPRDDAPAGRFQIYDAGPAPGAPAPPRTLGEELAHYAGLGARGFTENLIGIPTLAANAGIGLGNLVNRGTNALGLTDAAPFPSASELIDRGLTKMGVAEPETTAERVGTDIFGAVTGAGGLTKLAEKYGPGLASPMERWLASKMAQSPVEQMTAAGTGAAAADAARELGGGPVSQFAAGMLGAFAPGGASFLAKAGTRGFFRGANPQNMADRMVGYADAGITDPSVGQATGSATGQMADAGLSKYPGGQGVYANAAEQQAAQMGAKANALADQLLPNATATTAGETIKQGIANFMDRFRSSQKFLYDKVDQHIPPDTIVPVDNTLAKINDIAGRTAGAEQSIAAVRGQGLTDFAQKFMQDAGLVDAEGKPILTGNPGGMPYQAVKALRTAIGEKITNPSLTDNITTQQWRQVYGSLSQDMGAAAQAAGPDAVDAFNNANAYTKVGHDRIEGVLNSVVGDRKTLPERIFMNATTGMQDGATRIAGVMDSLQPAEQNAVTAAVIKRMGRTKPGAQLDPNELTPFSSDNFLTNWNAMTPEAREAIFPQPGMRDDLNKIATAAGYNKAGAKVFANPSGTAGSSALLNLGQAAIAFLLGSGSFKSAALGAASVPAAYGLAHLMNNPKFVHWLARSTEMPASLVPAQINQLTQFANKNFSDEDKAALEAYISGLSGALKAGAPVAEEGLPPGAPNLPIVTPGGAWGMRPGAQ